ncbi:hypothetical protein ACHAXA_000263 [Cyclostephanos tholiformis]|uniref:Beta-catenin-like protein 1 N-terminal domain-containing protein n=1 Tax=Cyclostephanos tholiformis TaxID=382380 RepID=A0ABD3SB73_9STRA
MSSKTTATGVGGGGVVDVLDGIIGLTSSKEEGGSEEVIDEGGVVGGGEGGRRKRARFDHSRDTVLVVPPRPSAVAAADANKKNDGRPSTAATGEELLAIAEEEAQNSADHRPSVLEPTSRGARAACKSLDRAIRKNRASRDMHPNDPSKFVDDEVALNDAILVLKDAAAYVMLYPELVECGMTDMLLTSLTHENVDVAAGVVEVLSELLDPSLLVVDSEDNEGNGDGGGDDPSKSGEGRARCIASLANAFVDGDGLDLLSSNLGRIDDTVEEEARCVEDALTLVESLLDLDRAGALGRSSSSSDVDVERPSVAAIICERTSLVPWLFERISRANGDDDSSFAGGSIATAATSPISPAGLRLHSSEVLSAIIQHEDYSTNRRGPRLTALPKYTSAFDDDDDGGGGDGKRKGGDKKNDGGSAATIDGMDVLLLAIAAYRKSDPAVEVECEFLENVFDVLAASLMRGDNVLDFVKAEGIELMLRCIRQKVHAGGGALRVLNFAMSGSSSSSNSENGDHDAYRGACEAFVNAGGLKLLSPLYMARKSAIPHPAACSDGGSVLARRGGINNKNSADGVGVSKRAKRAAHARRQWLVEVERNTLNIMYALTRNIAEDSPYDAHSRLMVKFVEEDCEKCDRTIELCLKYDERARIAEYQYFRSDEADEAERLGIDVETAALGAKLRGGGDLFHRTCAILSFACVGSKRCRGHVMDQLKLQGAGISVVKMGLNEFASSLGDGSQKSQIEHYIREI